MFLITDAGDKAGRTLVKTLFERMPAFALSHACIETEKLQQIPLGVGEIQRANTKSHSCTVAFTFTTKPASRRFT